MPITQLLGGWVPAIGNYSVTVTGSNGCPRTGNLDLLPGIDIPNVSFFSDTIDCDAPIQLIIPSDTSGLSFVYINDSATTYIDKVPATDESGTYDIRVTDLSGCFSDFVHVVEVDTIIPTVSLSSLEIDCNNDSVELRVINPYPIRSYMWTGPSGYTTNIKSPYTDVPGVYHVDFIGVNGCVNQDSIQINENFNLPMITPANSFFTCIKDEVSIGVQVDMNPSTYVWSGPTGFSSSETRPLVTESGDYYVTVKGPNGCINSDSIRVGYDTIVPTLTLVNDGFLTCPDPIVTLSGTSDETDIITTWIGPDTMIIGGLTLDVEDPGTWMMQVVDTAGCESTASVLVNTEIDYPDIEVEYNDIDCNVIFSKIEVQAGPLTENIFWTSPTPISQDVVEFNSNVAGVYEIFATGINGCDTTVTFEILKDTIPPEFILNVSDTITCNVQEVTLTASSMTMLSEYNWIGPSGFTSRSPAPSIRNGGRYIFHTRGLNGCSSVDTIFVAIDTISPAVQAMAEEITCIASKATLDVLSNDMDVTYEWSGPAGFSSTQQSPIAVTPGTYTVALTSRNGCVGVDRVELISNTEAPRIILEPTSYLLCDSTGINLGSNGCRSFDTTNVVVDTRLPDFIVASTNINCQEDMGNILAESVQDDLSFRWEGPNGYTSSDATTTVVDSGTYFLIVQGNNLCIDTQSVHVAIDRNDPRLSVFQEGVIQCVVTDIWLNGSASTGQSSLSFMWTTSDGNILSGENTSTPLIRGPGTYMATVVDNLNKCISDTTITVVSTEQEFDDFMLDLKNPSCTGFRNGSITYRDNIGANGQLLFSLDGGPFIKKDAFQFLDPGTYNITAMDSFGCQITKEVTLIPPRDISINAGEDRVVELGNTTDLLISTNVPPDSVNQMIWSDTSALICTKCLFQTIKPIRTTLYEIELTDLNGCKVTDDVLITVTPSVDIKLPNIFRPSSNNGNDKFYVAQTKGIKQVNYLSIFDRWGNRMFHAENFEPGNEDISWDGNFLDEPALPGVYPLVAEFVLDNGEIIIHHSDITIIR